MSGNAIKNSQDLLANAAHDIYNLLLPMRVHLESLAANHDAHDPAVQKSIAVLRGQCDSLDALANELLSVGVQHLDHCEICSLATLVQVYVEAFSTDAVEIYRSGKCLVKGDKYRLNRIISNLIINALEAGAEKVIVLTEEQTIDHPRNLKFGQLAPGNYSVLRVRDNGPGINPLILNYIFEPYFSTKDNRKHRGLGLASVARITSDLSGAIDVESMPGSTEISIYLPSANIEGAVRLLTPEAAILVYDNNKARLRQIIDEAASSEWYVIGASSFTELVSTLQLENADLLVIYGDSSVTDCYNIFSASINIRPGIQLLICGSSLTQESRRSISVLGKCSFIDQILDPAELKETLSNLLIGAE